MTSTKFANPKTKNYFDMIHPVNLRSHGDHLSSFPMARYLSRSYNRNKKCRPSFCRACGRTSFIDNARVVIKSPSYLQKKKRTKKYTSLRISVSDVSVGRFPRLQHTVMWNNFELTRRWFICVFDPTSTRNAYLRSQYPTNCKELVTANFFKNFETSLSEDITVEVFSSSFYCLKVLRNIINIFQNLANVESLNDS